MNDRMGFIRFLIFTACWVISIIVLGLAILGVSPYENAAAIIALMGVSMVGIKQDVDEI